MVPGRSGAPSAADAGRLYAVYFGFVGASSPYLPLLFAHWGFVALQIGALVATSQLIRIVAPPLWGWAADRGGKVRTLLQGSALVMTAACLALPAAGGLDAGWRFAAVAAVIVVLHLAGAGQGPLTETAALRIANGDLGRYGRMRVWGSVGFIATVIGFGALLDEVGVGVLPWLLASLGATLWLAASRLPRAPAGPSEPGPPVVPADAAGASGLAEAAGAAAAVASDGRTPSAPRIASFADRLRQPATRAFLAASALMVMAHAPFYGFFSLYLAALGFGKAAIGGFWAVGVGAEIVLFVYQRVLFERFSAPALLVATFALAVLRFGLTAWAAWLPPAATVAVLLAAQLLHAATFALHHSASMALLRPCFGERLLARAQATYTAVSYGVGGAIGGLGAGVIWQTWGPGATFVAASVVAALGIAAAAVVRRGFAQLVLEEEGRQ